MQGKAGIGMYNQFEKERDQGNFDLLPELHAILSGMKVRCPPLYTLLCVSSCDKNANLCTQIPCFDIMCSSLGRLLVKLSVFALISHCLSSTAVSIMRSYLNMMTHQATHY